MAKAYECDICKKLTRKADSAHKIRVDNNHNTIFLTYKRFETHLDLCNECKIAFLQKAIDKIKKGD